MIDEKKTSEELVAREVARGEKGIVGTASSAMTLKLQWHEATHLLVEAGDKSNPHRQAWMKKAGTPSLKRWAREQVKTGNQTAKDWFDSKNGLKNEKRSDKNYARVALERQASKSARKKAGAGKQAKPAAVVAAK